MPVAYASGNSLVTVGDAAHDEPVDNVHWASMGDGAACAVVVAEVGVHGVGDDDTRGDCSTVSVLHGNRSAHPGNNSVRGGKLVAVDRSIPIDLVVGDGAGWEALPPLDWRGIMHQDLVGEPDHSDCCIPAMGDEAGDENHGRAVARDNGVSKSPHEHKLLRNSRRSQHCRYHKPIVDFGQTVPHYWECSHELLRDATVVEALRTTCGRSPYQGCMMVYDTRRGMVVGS